MTNLDLTSNELTSPGLYIMRWKGRTGLVRVVGEPKSGYRLLNPENPKETLMTDVPPGGAIPPDAKFSDALNLVVS